MRSWSPTIVALLVPGVLLAQAPRDLPLKHAGPPTTAGITAADLMTRLYQFADDSMMGRAVGTPYNVKAAEFIEREARRLGLTPAGENGGFFQELPLGTRSLDSASTLTASGRSLRAGIDFLATAAGTPRQLQGAQVIFGGAALDTTNLPAPGAWDGKVVLLTPFAPGQGFNFQQLQNSDGFRRYNELTRNATIATVAGDSFATNQVRTVMASTNVTFLQPGNGNLVLTVTRAAAEAMLGRPLAGARRGQTGQRVSSDIRIRESRRALGRNVVAIIPGSDPVLRHQFLAIGAHNDHIGYTFRPIDHDSTKLHLRLFRPQGVESPNRALNDGERAMLQVLLDSVRAVRPPRLDSINNGADDDGSGSMALLELAEAFMAAPVKPKRSLLLVWHAGEERGMWGSSFYTDNPTVTRDSIVAQLNLDMLGRGGPDDITGVSKWGGFLRGDDRYIQVMGSRRLSTELGDLIDAENGIRERPFRLDYAMDSNGHPQNIYCRSDHYEYARYGIPIAFFTTGGHADYHQVTDEPQYIRYDHLAEITRFIHDLAVRLGNLDRRPVVDKPVPDRALGCRQ